MDLTLPEWRSKHDKTQAWIAEQTGIDQSTISRYESGDASPSRKHSILIRDITAGANTAGDVVGVDSWDRIPRRARTAILPEPSAA